MDTIGLFKILASQRRLDIIRCLWRAPKMEESFQNIRNWTHKMPRATMSQHMKILVDAGLVKVTPVGRFSMAKLTPTPLLEVILEEIER